MKTMRVTVTTTCIMLMLFAGILNAQESPVSVGIKGGVNLSTFGGDMKDTKNVLRYQIGITADLGITENIYLQTGIDFLTKGAKYKPKNGESITYNPMYLQLPIHAAYKIDIAPATRFVVNAGPYIAYGLGGKAKGSDKTDIFGKDKFKRFDYGVGGGVGVEFGKIAVNLGYDFGLANINHEKKNKVRNQHAFLTVGYKF